MGRIAVVDSYLVRHRVHALKAEGLSLRAIAAACGFKDKKSVQQYLAVPPSHVAPADVIAAAVALKAGVCSDFGPDRLLDVLAEQLGFERSNPPVSSSLISAVLKEKDLTKRQQQNTTGGDRPRWWLCEYDRPLRVFQIDTVKLVLQNGSQVEIFSCIDVVSRALWMEVLPKHGSLAHCLNRAFDALGVPDMVSSDNGQGMTPYSQQRLSDVVYTAFLRGVKEFHFIPVAMPWFNGVVERVHRTLKRGDWLHRGRETVVTADQVPAFLSDFLRDYNMLYSHSSLSTKRNRVTPAKAHGCYTHLEPAPHQFGKVARSVEVDGTVSFSRQASSQGALRIDSPAWVVHVPSPVAYGNFLRAKFNLDGSGTCYLLREGVEEVVGTFTHTLRGYEPITREVHLRDANGYVWLGVTLSAELPCEALPFDELADLERERKHLKAGARKPLDSNHIYRDAVDCTEIVDITTGQIISTDEQIIVDHRGEILGDGW